MYFRFVFYFLCKFSTLQSLIFLWSLSIIMMKSERFFEINLKIAQKIYRKNIKFLFIKIVKSIFRISFDDHHATIHIKYSFFSTQNKVFVDVVMNWRYKWCCSNVSSNDNVRCYIKRCVKYFSCAFYRLNRVVNFSRYVFVLSYRFFIWFFR